MHNEDFDPWEHLDELRCSVEEGLAIVAVIEARKQRGELCRDDLAIQARWQRRLAQWRAEWPADLQRATGLTRRWGA